MILFVSKGNKYFDLKSGPEEGKNNDTIIRFDHHSRSYQNNRHRIRVFYNNKLLIYVHLKRTSKQKRIPTANAVLNVWEVCTDTIYYTSSVFEPVTPRILLAWHAEDLFNWLL